MTDELRQAAERFGNPKPGEAYHWPCEMHEQPLQRSLDAGLLARAYLAEHPADDGEPVTGEWLRAVGFYNVHPEGPNHYLRNKQGLFVIHDANGWRTLEFLAVNPTYLPTRVHVRRLCAALGAPLQEPP